MRTIRFIIRKEFIQIRRDPAMIRIIFLIPIIQLLVLGFVVSSDVKNIQTVICDMDASPTSRQLIDRLNNSGYFTIKYYDTRQNYLAHYLDSGKATVALVIPKGLSKNLMHRRRADIQILVDGQDANTSNIALGYINGILQNFLTDIITSQDQTIMDLHLIVPNVRVWYNPELKNSDAMIPPLVVFLLTMITALISAMGLVREREIGTLEQLVVAPIKKHELLIGKIIPFAILGFVVLAIAVFVAKLVYDIPIAGSLGLFALFALVFLFTTLGIGLFVSASARTQQQAMFMTLFLMIFFLIMSGFLFPIENMPKMMQYISYINPLRYFVVVVREIFIKGADLTHLYPQGIVLVIFGGTIFSFAAFRFQSRIK